MRIQEKKLFEMMKNITHFCNELYFKRNEKEILELFEKKSMDDKEEKAPQ